MPMLTDTLSFMESHRLGSESDSRKKGSEHGGCLGNWDYWFTGRLLHGQPIIQFHKDNSCPMPRHFPFLFSFVDSRLVSKLISTNERKGSVLEAEDGRERM